MILQLKNGVTLLQFLSSLRRRLGESFILYYCGWKVPPPGLSLPHGGPETSDILFLTLDLQHSDHNMRVPHPCKVQQHGLVVTVNNLESQFCLFWLRNDQVKLYPHLHTVCILFIWTIDWLWSLCLAFIHSTQSIVRRVSHHSSYKIQLHCTLEQNVMFHHMLKTDACVNTDKQYSLNMMFI